MFNVLRMLKRKENKLERISNKMKEELGIELLTVSDTAINQYRRLTNDNHNLSDEACILKLNRNFHCSNKVLKDDERSICKAYGNMKIYYNKAHNEIYNIINNRTRIHNMKIDEILKAKLNKIMEL